MCKIQYVDRWGPLWSPLCMCTALARNVIVSTPLQLQAIRAVGPLSLPAIEIIT